MGLLIMHIYNLFFLVRKSSIRFKIETNQDTVCTYSMRTLEHVELLKITLCTFKLDVIMKNML